MMKIKPKKITEKRPPSARLYFKQRPVTLAITNVLA